MKRVEALRPCDFATYPVWEYVGESELLHGDYQVVQVTTKSITHLDQRLVGVYVSLQNAQRRFCLLGNISLGNPTSTQHFLTASFFRNRKWFHLARYHDWDYARRGPNQLATFLGLDIASIFPISYDLASVKGLRRPIKGVIYKSPPVRLSRDKLIQLAVESS
jgi:hypothetical protein